MGPDLVMPIQPCFQNKSPHYGMGKKKSKCIGNVIKSRKKLKWNYTTEMKICLKWYLYSKSLCQWRSFFQKFFMSILLFIKNSIRASFKKVTFLPWLSSSSSPFILYISWFFKNEIEQGLVSGSFQNLFFHEPLWARGSMAHFHVEHLWPIALFRLPHQPTDQTCDDSQMYNLGRSQTAYWVTLKAKQHPGFKPFIESEICEYPQGTEKDAACLFKEMMIRLSDLSSEAERKRQFLCGSVLAWDCNLITDGEHKKIVSSSTDTGAKSSHTHTQTRMYVLCERSNHWEMVIFPPIKFFLMHCKFSKALSKSLS